jgi:pilus assembly protein CpaB
MSPARIGILAVAAVSAIGLAFIVRGMASGGKPEAPAPVVQTAEKPMAKVLVASRDLGVGARVAPGDLTWQAWPLESLNEKFITDGSVAIPKAEPTPEEKKAAEEKAKADGADKGAVDQAKEQAAAAANALFGEGGPMEALAGAVVRETILKGEPVTERKLVRAGQSGYLAIVLQPGMRAMAIPVSVETAAGGFVLPGDRVDVLLSRQVQGAQGQVHRADTVLQNVKVLAIDQTTKAPEDGAQSVVGAVATLEVGESDAEALAQADAQGDLALTLRSYADVGGPSGRTTRLLTTDAGMVRVWRDGTASAVSATN